MIDVTVTASKLVLVTSTANVTGPPGSGTESTPAVFVTTTVGGTSVISTDASSSSVAVVPSLSTTVATTVSSTTSPASPDTTSVNVQE